MFVLLLEKIYKAVFKFVSFQDFEKGHPLRIKGWPLLYDIGWFTVYAIYLGSLFLCGELAQQEFQLHPGPILWPVL